MDKIYANMRQRIVNIQEQSVKVTKIRDLLENNDDNCFVNCEGYGRIRKYKNFSLFMANRFANEKRKLFRGIEEKAQFETQVFQIGGCDLRCWYCFVDDQALSVQSESLEWLSVTKMIDYVLQSGSNIIDLSGGQPDIVPEWALWTMNELEKRSLLDDYYIWVDDNLNTVDIMEETINKNDILRMANNPKHSRMCCFKGVDEESVSYTCRSSLISHKKQIENFERLYKYGFDLYAYITLVFPSCLPAESRIREFIYELRSINTNIPLRVIPLYIKEFSVTKTRMTDEYKKSLEEQEENYRVWNDIMHELYTKEQLAMKYEDIKIY